jgi:hypothetical protein
MTSYETRRTRKQEDHNLNNPVLSKSDIRRAWIQGAKETEHVDLSADKEEGAKENNIMRSFMHSSADIKSG